MAAMNDQRTSTRLTTVLFLVIVAAGLAALAPASASASRGATMFVHSASSGELRGDRLTLRGVGRHVGWTTNGGRSGRVSIARLHRRLFSPGRAPASGTLDIAGGRPGSELALELSRPRYDARRQTVAYRVKRLRTRRSGSGRAGAAAQRPLPRRFGPASLTIVGSPRVRGGIWSHDCQTRAYNGTNHGVNGAGYNLRVISATNWDTDTWTPGNPTGNSVPPTWELVWTSEGGLFRGCWSQVVLGFDTFMNQQNPPPVTFTITHGWPWNGDGSVSCTSSDPDYVCRQGTDANFSIFTP
jgi:hypothetical protein